MRLPQGVLVAHSLPEGVDFRGFDPVGSAARSRGPTTASTARTSSGWSGAATIAARTPARSANWSAAKLLITGHEPCREGFVAPNDLQIILDCCGDKAAYVILPVGVELSHAEIMRRVEFLED